MEDQNSSLIPPPFLHSSSISSSASCNSVHEHNHHTPTAAVAAAASAVPITRSEPNNPYPTTFVQADTFSFKKVVQMLTGSTETARIASRSQIPPARNGPRKNKSGAKLYERRNSLKNFRISPLAPGLVNTARAGLVSGYSGSPQSKTPDTLSPSILNFPSLILSPVTPLIPDLFNREVAGGHGKSCSLDKQAEEKTIKEKGFYLHLSPASTQGKSEPRLLSLFPVTSPTAAGSSESV